MIEGKSKITFGNGDIRATIIINETDNVKSGMLVLENNLDGHAVGENVALDPQFSIGNKDVLIVFDTKESLDVIIERLTSIKTIWEDDNDNEFIREINPDDFKIENELPL